ncbi:hypothetical protein O6H91_05G128200 [Diphasiastrum complanatum]|nr:hypothetical protein O6H91_05G128200 [Diphasiastrum complanatum]
MNIDDIHSLKRLGETKQSMEDEAIQAAESNDDKSNGQQDGNFGGIGPAEKPIHDANLAEASDFNSSIMNRQRFVGPAAPSKEQLAAAARLSEAESILREAEDELEQNPFVGPPPPAAVAEAESANEAERFEEVARILSLESGNAYELLGAKPDSSVEVIKKRYWKLSLLVHPDKCAHPQAQQAFTAVNRAFKDIEDPTKRAEIDRKLAEKQMREEYEEELKSLREAAHWRRLRGEPLEGDDDLLGGGTTVAGRDEWMTSLPPERKAGAPSMHSTFFSKSGREGRGDTSSWTDNPLEKAEKAKMQYLEAYKHAALTAAEDAKEIVEKQKTSKIAELVDKYNENKRPRSLLEEHKLKTAGKPQKVAQKTPGTQQDDWAGKHPWKPWDREKDLMAGRKPVSLDAKIMGQGLSSRFSSSGSERKFL